MINVKHYFVSVVFFMTDNIWKVLAETCSNGKICRNPYKCCDGACCHDNDDYVYEYRMSFWNLWYFWFIILFVLMSCFGGCGYYKQRQRMLRARANSPSHTRTRRRTRTIILTNPGETTTPYTYRIPGGDTYNNMFLPPPYSEVMLHPGLYPNNKDTLPPYPGDPMQGRTEAVPINNDVVLPQPPPYSELSNQNTDLQQAAYQNTAHLQTTRHRPDLESNQNTDLQQAAYQNTAHLQTTRHRPDLESNQNATHNLAPNQNAAS